VVLRQGGANAAALHPYAQICSRPQDRLDRAVSQGLSVLAGLALGRSGGG
jgi:hypothetical protein